MSYSGVGRFKFKWDVIQWCRGGSNSSGMSYSGVGEVQIQVICHTVV